MATEATIRADIAKLERQADEFVLKRKNKLNAAQQTSLNKLLTRIAKLYVALSKQPTTPDPVTADVVLIDVGSSPLPNNAQSLADGQSYGCDVDREAFTSKYGASPQVILSRVLTGILRPNAMKWAHITDRAIRNQSLQADLTRQQAAIDWLAGRIPFGELSGYLGNWDEIFGCAPLSELRDLGPS